MKREQKIAINVNRALLERAIAVDLGECGERSDDDEGMGGVSLKRGFNARR